MHRNRWIIVVISTALLAPVAHAQNEAAEAKAAAKGLYGAVTTGDAAGIQKYLVVENDTQQQLARTYADLILAGKKLGDAAKQRFPGAAGAFSQGTILPEDAHLIDTAEATIDGDKASLKLSGRAEAVNLRRIDGAWKVFIRQPEDSPQRREQQKALLTGWIGVMNQTATEILDNQFPTIQLAEGTLKDRMGAVLAKALQGSPPSSQPATQAAG